MVELQESINRSKTNPGKNEHDESHNIIAAKFVMHSHHGSEGCNQQENPVMPGT